jgi:hypothetical protein
LSLYKFLTIDLLKELFPEPLSDVLIRTAEAFSLPYEGMLSSMLFQACNWNATTYVSRPGRSQIEPVMAFFLDNGESGSNKTGLYKLNEHIIEKVKAVIQALKGDINSQFEIGFKVMRDSIPVRDCTSTPAATIQKQSQHRVLTRLDDEWLIRKRALGNGSSGVGLEHGVQHPLCVFNGPMTMANELKSNIEEAFVPRFISMAYVQPSLFESDFGIDSPLFPIGFTSRHLLSNVQKNFDSSGNRTSMQPDDLSMVAFVLAIAIRNGLIVTGEWKLREDAAELAESFNGTDESILTHAEEVELSITTNRFTPDCFCEKAVVDVERAMECKVLKARNVHERAKAAALNKPVAGRFNVDVFPEPSPDDGLSEMLPRGFADAGLIDMRMIECYQGSLEDTQMAISLRQLEQQAADTPSLTMKNILGKSSGYLLRLTGMFTIIEEAAQDVEDCFVETIGCNGICHLVGFAKSIILKMQAEPAMVGADENINERFGTGTALESRIPQSRIMHVTTTSQRSGLLASEYFISNMLRALKIPTRPIGNEPGVTSGAAAAEVSLAPLTGGRFEFLLKEMCQNAFFVAPLNKVSSIRFRKSSKGMNQGDNELDLLVRLQNSGLFNFTVHCAVGTNLIVVYKTDLSGASTSCKLRIHAELTKLGLCLDEYIANSSAGPFDVTISSLPALVPGPVPYGLRPLKNSNEPNAPPLPTQDRAGGQVDEVDENSSPNDAGGIDKKTRIEARPHSE